MAALETMLNETRIKGRIPEGQMNSNPYGARRKGVHAMSHNIDFATCNLRKRV